MDNDVWKDMSTIDKVGMAISGIIMLIIAIALTIGLCVLISNTIKYYSTHEVRCTEYGLVTDVTYRTEKKQNCSGGYFSGSGKNSYYVPRSCSEYTDKYWDITTNKGIQTIDEEWVAKYKQPLKGNEYCTKDGWVEK